MSSKLKNKVTQLELQNAELKRRLEEYAHEKWKLQRMIETKTITNGRLLDKVVEAKRVLGLLKDITVNPELIQAIEEWEQKHG